MSEFQIQSSYSILDQCRDCEELPVSSRTSRYEVYLHSDLVSFDNLSLTGEKLFLSLSCEYIIELQLLNVKLGQGKIGREIHNAAGPS